MNHFSCVQHFDTPNNEPVMDICTDILQQLPQYLSLNQGNGIIDSMTLVLNNEITKFNSLLMCIKETLTELAQALQGHCIITPQLEVICEAIKINQIPITWKSLSYLTLKPLSSFVHDLVAKIKFFQKWSTDGVPSVFWFSAFYSPHAFITSILQNSALSTKIKCLDMLKIDYYVTEFECNQMNSNEFNTMFQVTIYNYILFSA